MFNFSKSNGKRYHILGKAPNVKFIKDKRVIETAHSTVSANSRLLNLGDILWESNQNH